MADNSQTTGCPMPDDVCADCGYRCGEDVTEDELRELFGGPARPIERTPEEDAAVERYVAFVHKNGHLP